MKTHLLLLLLHWRRQERYLASCKSDEEANLLETTIGVMKGKKLFLLKRKMYQHKVVLLVC